MLYDTHKKGEVALLRVAIRAAEKGCVFSRPTTEARYDAVLDVDGSLKRIQVKYADADAANADGSLRVDLRRKTNGRHSKTRVYRDGEVDALLVYVPRTGNVLWFNAAEFIDKASLTIRLEHPRNNQKTGVLFEKAFVW